MWALPLQQPSVPIQFTQTDGKEHEQKANCCHKKKTSSNKNILTLFVSPNVSHTGK